MRSRHLISTVTALRRSPGKGVEGLTGPDSVAAVVRSISSHPSLQTVLLPQLEGQRGQLYVGIINVIIGLAQVWKRRQGSDRWWEGWMGTESCLEQHIQFKPLRFRPFAG